MNESQWPKDVVLVVDRNPQTSLLLQSIAIQKEFDLTVIWYKTPMKAFEGFIDHFGSGRLLCVFMGGKLDGEGVAQKTLVLANKMIEMANRAQRQIFIFGHTGTEESGRQLMQVGCCDTILRIADDMSGAEFYANDIAQAFVTAGAHAAVSLEEDQKESELAPA